MIASTTPAEADATPAVPVLPEFLATRSSNVHGIALRDGVLFVKFSSGTVYAYRGEGVEAHHAAMLSAESVGKYFAQHVRNDKAITCQRVEFCAACGASIPPKDGEGVCGVCVPGAPPKGAA